MLSVSPPFPKYQTPPKISTKDLVVSAQHARAYVTPSSSPLIRSSNPPRLSLTTHPFLSPKRKQKHTHPLHTPTNLRTYTYRTHPKNPPNPSPTPAPPPSLFGTKHTSRPAPGASTHPGSESSHKQRRGSERVVRRLVRRLTGLSLAQ